MSTKAPTFQAAAIATDTRVAILAARFNAPIVDELITGCRRRLLELKLTPERIETFRVPGAFELPLAAQLAARTGRFAAIICLGAIVRGDTPHFEYVAGECARGIGQVSLSSNLPVIFGVLTTNTEAQARDRIGGAHGHTGERAAEAALEMIALAAALRPHP
jgi:6,7-dimethyl-8-ribityllumazine synthase